MADKPFPVEKYADIGSFFSDYQDQVHAALSSVDSGGALSAAADILRTVFARQGILYVCGNGGSAAISNHMTCDILKGVRSDTNLTPRIVSLSTQVELITAIANDSSYDEVFVYQLKSLAKPGDALMTISSSGDSENIVRAIEWAQAEKLPTISLTGFSGGRSAKLSDINIHVEADNYGVIEDAHQSVMHVLSQYLRMAGMTEELVEERKF